MEKTENYSTVNRKVWTFIDAWHCERKEKKYKEEMNLRRRTCSSEATAACRSWAGCRGRGRRRRRRRPAGYRTTTTSPTRRPTHRRRGRDASHPRRRRRRRPPRRCR